MTILSFLNFHLKFSPSKSNHPARLKKSRFSVIIIQLIFYFLDKNFSSNSVRVGHVF